jgi:hypothetical protein
MLRFALVLCFTSCLLQAGAPSVEEGRKHWAFQPLKVSAGKHDVDGFIKAKLAEAGLQLSPAARPAALLRRVSLDLTGLLPTPEQVAAFEANPSAEAYAAIVDQLLASPQYGERWGRHWLDLARYADTSGFHNDLERPHAWKYRDYVIRCFNEDKPYADFIAEQLAGDELEHSNEAALIATGFCRNGPSNDDNMGKTPESIEQYLADQRDDVVATTASVFLGLTLGCARCHDHKTEPLLAQDYYSFSAVFAGTERMGLPSGATDAKDKRVKDTATVMALVQSSAVVPATHILQRGLASAKGAEVQAAVPAVLQRGSVDWLPATAKNTQRRHSLARWIAEQPITWRVLANRIWQHHFGTGLVSSPSNLGVSGELPSHPELLDWLALELRRHGGRWKAVHREILLSRTYQQSSAHQGSAPAVDPLNRLLWRMPMQRMEAEVLRDCILCASGKLELKMGGRGVKPRIRPELLDASQRNRWPEVKQESAAQWRRSVYIYAKRQLLMPSLELFDAPTTVDSCAARTQSTVPTQALVLMNDEFVEQQAGYLARRAAADGKDLAGVVRELFMITLSKQPGEQRLADALEFVQAKPDRYEALRDLAHVLLNSSEFLYIE